MALNVRVKSYQDIKPHMKERKLAMPPGHQLLTKTH